jgi:hypothetical protein
MAIEHADFDGIERLALVTGGEIVSTFGNPDLVRLGRCDLIEQVCDIFIVAEIFLCFPQHHLGYCFIALHRILSVSSIPPFVQLRSSQKRRRHIT